MTRQERRKCDDAFVAEVASGTDAQEAYLKAYPNAGGLKPRSLSVAVAKAKKRLSLEIAEAEKTANKIANSFANKRDISEIAEVAIWTKMDKLKKVQDIFEANVDSPNIQLQALKLHNDMTGDNAQSQPLVVDLLALALRHKGAIDDGR